MTTPIAIVLAALLSLGTAPRVDDDEVKPLGNDFLVLKDGRLLENIKLEKKDKTYIIHYHNGDVVVPEAMVKEVLIESAGGYVPKNEAEKKKVAKGLVPYKGKWMSKKKRDSSIAKAREKKRVALEELKAHRLWRNRYKTKSKNFHFEYTIDPEIGADYQAMMEIYYKNFAKEWKIKRPKDVKPLMVGFYHDREYFGQVAGAGGGTLAYYRFVPPLELHFFFDRTDPEFTRQVMFHEAAHHLMHLINIDFSYPHNIGEGMAEYFGGSSWDPKAKKMKNGVLLEGRLVEVRSDIEGGKYESLRDYLTLKLGYKDYNWGYTFCHFMMESRKYRKNWIKFFRGLAHDKGVKRSGNKPHVSVDGDELLRYFQKKMKVKDLDKLEKEWWAHIDQNMVSSSAKGFAEAARMAEGNGQRIRARRFYKSALAEKTEDPKVYTAYANYLVSEGKSDEAKELLEKALTFDPLAASVYAALGRIYRTKDNKEKATSYFALAREIDPDNYSLLMDEALQKLNDK